jgi:diacylglycerol kinase (ATP)
MTNSSNGMRRLIKAFGYSIKGMKAGWRNEAAFRQEVTLACFLCPLAFWLGRSPLDYALLISSVLLVLVTELFNSAIEALTDRIGTEHHELSGRAKDLASAAVFIALIILLIIWFSISWIRFISN